MSLALAAGRPPADTRRLLGLRAVADDHLVRDDGAAGGRPGRRRPVAGPARPRRGRPRDRGPPPGAGGAGLPAPDPRRARPARHRGGRRRPRPRHRRRARRPAAPAGRRPPRLPALLARDHRLLERRAYLAVAVPAAPTRPPPRAAWAGCWPAPRPRPRPAPDEAARELAARCAELDRRLRPAGVAVRRLAGAELAGLLHRLVQPDLARRQPLPADLADLAAGPVESAGRARAGRGRRALRRPGPRPGRLPGPGAAEEAPDWLRVDDRYAATLAVIGYRREVGADWLAPLWRCGLPLRVAFHLDPLADRTALGRLERRKTRLEAAAAVDARQGRTHKAAAAVALEDVTALEEAVERGAERLLTLGLYVTVEAESPAGLAERLRHLESVLGGLGLRSARLPSRQPAGYRATLPLGRDEPQRGHAMTARRRGGRLPVRRRRRRRRRRPARRRPARRRPGRAAARRRRRTATWSRSAPPAAARATPSRRRCSRPPCAASTVWVVDREGEYAALVAAPPAARRSGWRPARAGGGLNPLALPPAPHARRRGRPRPRPDRRARRDRHRAGRPARRRRRGGLTATEEAVVDEAIRAAYAAAGVTADPATWAHPPTLADLQRRLAAGDGTARGLAVRLARHTDGAYAGLFAGDGGRAGRRPPGALGPARPAGGADRRRAAAAGRRRLDRGAPPPARPPAGHRRGLAPDRPPGRRPLPRRPGPPRPQARPGPVGDQPGRARPARGPRTAAPSPPTPPPRCCRRRTTGRSTPSRPPSGWARASGRCCSAPRSARRCWWPAGQRRAVRVLVMPELDPLITTDPAALLRGAGRPAIGDRPDAAVRRSDAEVSRCCAAGLSARTRPSSSAATRSRTVVARAGVRLRRSGARLVGRCPFHDDRTPVVHRLPRPGELPLLRLRRARRRLRLHHGRASAAPSARRSRG